MITETAQEQHTMPEPGEDMPAGEALRRARLHCGLSMEDVARALNIRTRQVDALERGDIAALPAPVYAVGFMRAYAEHVGLDAVRVVALFKAQSRGAAEPRADLNFPIPAGDSAAPPWWAVGLGLLAAVVLIWAWLVWQGGQSGQAPEEVPSPPPAVETPDPVPAAPAPAEVMGPPAPPAEATQAPAAVQEAAAPVSAQAGAAEEILLTIVADSWVEVRDAGGQALVARVLRAGERYTVPSQADLTMTLGNAEGVELSVGGRALAPPGRAGEIVRDIPLDAKVLLDRYGAGPVE